jgi:hypothetical protein
VARLEAVVPQAFAHFGDAVAIDGTTIVVGAEDDPASGTSTGAAFIFERGSCLIRNLQPRWAFRPVF